MKFDEKTGKKIPENRTDEITLTMERLKEHDERCEGTLNPTIVTNTMLSDISVSLGLLVDMVGTMLNMKIKAEKIQTEKNTSDSPQ